MPGNYSKHLGYESMLESYVQSPDNLLNHLQPYLEISN